jgi:arsenate reductase (thioredoxin)
MAEVLFVCVHNAGRSQMAEAFFNRLATDQGLSVRAASAGTVCSGSINPVAVKVLEEIGISMEGHFAKTLTPEMVASAKTIVSMGCGVDAEACPTRFLVTEDWGLDDPAGQAVEFVREVRDQIKLRVERMILDFTGTSAK